RIQEQGYEVTVFDRDPISHREKEVDIALALSVGGIIASNDPGILILVSGDRDYAPAVEKALQKNWIVQTWFWTSGMSCKLKAKTHFYSLDNCYRSFAYGRGPDPTGEMKVLEVTEGNIIKSWGDEKLIELFNTLNLFGWWNWFGSSSVQIYFDNRVNLEIVKNYIQNNYQKYIVTTTTTIPKTLEVILIAFKPFPAQMDLINNSALSSFLVVQGAPGARNPHLTSLRKDYWARTEANSGICSTFCRQANTAIIHCFGHWKSTREVPSKDIRGEGQKIIEQYRNYGLY
ncbi:1321_t:CDS:2, partial [Paraglomus occultum]